MRDTGCLQLLLLQILKWFMAGDKAFVLAKELAGKNMKDTRPAEPGRSLQITDAEKDIAESPKCILNHHRVELSS